MITRAEELRGIIFGLQCQLKKCENEYFSIMFPLIFEQFLEMTADDLVCYYRTEMLNLYDGNYGSGHYHKHINDVYIEAECSVIEAMMCIKDCDNVKFTWNGITKEYHTPWVITPILDECNYDVASKFPN